MLTRALVLNLVLLLAVALPAVAQDIGSIVEVVGGVDVLRSGKLPAIPARTGDKVAKGDIIRTKSDGRVKIALTDDSVLTIAPGTRVALSDFHYIPQEQQRQAVIKIFYGLLHTLVTKIFKKEQPDFIVETNTATIGVRGTDYYTLVAPDASDIYNHTGKTEVSNIFPEIPGKVVLEGLAYTRVGYNLPPTLPIPITLEDIKWLDGQMSPKMAAAPDRGFQTQLAAQAGAVGLRQPLVQMVVLTTLTQLQGNPIQNPQSAVYVPPQPPQPAPGVVLATPFHFWITWGAGASDLDLHLTGPLGTGAGRFHVYYGNSGSLTGPPYALLHLDQISTNGSEVITVSRFIAGDVYRASVYNFSDQSPTSTNLSTASGVQMKLVTGGTVANTSSGSVVTGGTILATLTPPSGLAGNTWRAVEINPATGQINQVNQILNSSSSSAVQ